MLTLNEYLRLSKKLIASYEKRTGEKIFNDDMIGDVANAMMRADWNYDARKSELEPYQYRRMFGLNAILWRKKSPRAHKRVPFDSFGYHKSLVTEQTPLDILIEQEQLGRSCIQQRLDFLLNNAGLTDIQKDYMKLYSTGQTIADVARAKNVSEQNASQTINIAMSKLRSIVNASV